MRELAKKQNVTWYDIAVTFGDRLNGIKRSKCDMAQKSPLKRIKFCRDIAVIEDQKPRQKLL